MPTVVTVDLTIDLLSAVPSYQQLAARLRAAIEAGEVGPGEPLPSLTRLQQETGLAVGTIRRAIGVLESEGIVATVPGRGSYVRPAG